ncbi:MAG: hypothetical protein IIZ18_03560 [Ruminococcus sp.]|nr:hypothetical protein [Ruminococcus sp.]
MGEKKKPDYTFLKEIPFFLVMLVMLLLFIAGLLGKFMGISMLLAGKLISSESFTWASVLIMCAVVLTYSGMRRKDGTVKKAPFVVAVILMVLTAFPFISGLVSDLKETSVSENTVIDADTDALLTEVTSHDKASSKDLTHINVYKITGIFAKKLGEIDETYYSVKSLEEGKLVCTYSDDASVLMVECGYGTFGNERVQLTPEYDTGTLKYEFKLK